MGIDDLAMDMETLVRLLKGMNIPQNQYTNYPYLLKEIKESHIAHPDAEATLKLIASIQKRLE